MTRTGVRPNGDPHAATRAASAAGWRLARRFAAEPQWRRWTALAVTAGVLTIVFIAGMTGPTP